MLLSLHVNKHELNWTELLLLLLLLVVVVVVIVIVVVMPVYVAEQSKAWAVFPLSDAGIVGSNLTQGMDVWCVYVFDICLCCPVFR
jgi:hypothetical protein